MLRKTTLFSVGKLWFKPLFKFLNSQSAHRAIPTFYTTTLRHIPLGGFAFCTFSPSLINNNNLRKG